MACTRPNHVWLKRHACVSLHGCCLDYSSPYWISYRFQEIRTLFSFSKTCSPHVDLPTAHLPDGICFFLSLLLSIYTCILPNPFPLSPQISIPCLLISLFSPLCPSLVPPPPVSYGVSLSVCVLSLVSLVLCQCVDFIIHLTDWRPSLPSNINMSLDLWCHLQCTSPLHHSQHVSLWLDLRVVWSIWTPSWLQIMHYRKMAV